MFNQDIQRVGFACKYIHTDESLPKRRRDEIQKQYTERSTTNKWLSSQTQTAAYNRLWEIMKHNIESITRLIKYVGSLPPGQRMLRMSSDRLPFFTHDDWSHFYQRNDVKTFAERGYARVGELARELDVRLSFHPGQFTVLASDRDDVVERSIAEMEYHATVAKWMGYGQQFQDFKINVHLSGRRGAQGIRDIYGRLSPELRNMMTIENDEFTSGLRDIIELADLVALVFDTHHHWVHSNEFISPQRDDFQRVIESWRGVRPVIHYSVSREEYLTEVADDELPDRNVLKESGFASTKIRAHSDYYTHSASNDMVAEFWPYADIMAESKMKNLASTQLYNYLEKTV